jgi:hypothetical protein
MCFDACLQLILVQADAHAVDTSVALAAGDWRFVNDKFNSGEPAKAGGIVPVPHANQCTAETAYELECSGLRWPQCLDHARLLVREFWQGLVHIYGGGEGGQGNRKRRANQPGPEPMADGRREMRDCDLCLRMVADTVRKYS